MIAPPDSSVDRDQNSGKCLLELTTIFNELDVVKNHPNSDAANSFLQNEIRNVMGMSVGPHFDDAEIVEYAEMSK